MSALEHSYQYCRGVARARARNFYYSFLLLPKPKRSAMCAIYAFMRECDDISDEPRDGGVPAAREALELWRGQLHQTLAGSPGTHPLWPAFLDTVSRFRIPHHYFDEMIDGVGRDLQPQAPATFDDLYRYCYLVASVVGLTIIHIFEFHDPKALVLAESCGVAFQLTNIIRDVAEDAGNGRVYLPGVTLAEAKSPESTLPHLRTLGDRAEAYYRESRPLLGMIGADSRSSLWALIEIYHRLLERMKGSGYAVHQRRIRLSSWEKSAIVAQAWLLNPAR